MGVSYFLLPMAVYTVLFTPSRQTFNKVLAVRVLFNIFDNQFILVLENASAFLARELWFTLLVC